MQARVAAIRAGTAGEQVWLVEHPPLYTAGTSARPDQLTDPSRFPTFIAGRGGQWTYHGPGQRTGYVMLDLMRRHGGVPAQDMRCYVNGLEEWLSRTLDRFNVKGERREGRVGIWVIDPASGAEAKIGARVTRWVSWHGVALNVEPDLSHFSGIIPCGLPEYGVIVSLRWASQPPCTMRMSRCGKPGRRCSAIRGRQPASHRGTDRAPRSCRYWSWQTPVRPGSRRPA
jgi:lipoyl(octanoyl) transferase